MELALSLGTDQIVTHSDSQLIANQMFKIYGLIGELMTKYLDKTQRTITKFSAIKMVRTLRIENVRVHSLARLASVTMTELKRTILVKLLANKSIYEQEVILIEVDLGSLWMDPIKEYFEGIVA